MARRPKLKVPFQHIDIAIELLSIALLLLMWLYVITAYSDLPDTIASHFNGSGKVDGYASKTYLWFLPLIATAMYIGLFIVNRYPHRHNYTVDITENNVFKQYQFSTRMIRIVNFLCTLLFAYITYAVIQSAKHNHSALGSSFLYIVIGASILLPIIVFVYQKKLNA